MTARFTNSTEPPRSDDNPLVSVVIDNYNYAAYLPAAIESALGQEYSSMEVVVVDDGSTDDSRLIIERYSSQLKSVYKRNGGQASALNAGFASSQGDIIVFLDADDILLPAAVSRVVQAFDHASISNVRWPMWIVDAKGHATGDMRPSKAPADGDFREQLLSRGPGNVPASPTSGNAWRRQYLEQVLPIPENVRYYQSCADEYLFTLAPAFGRLRTIGEPQSCYRIHGKNVYSSKSFGERLLLELEHYDEHCRSVSTALLKLGIPVDISQWKQNSWFHRLEKGVADIHRLVPKDASFALVDGNTWDAPGAFGTRRATPFTHRNGIDWGPPADSNAAIEQLDVLLDERVEYLVIAWPCYWWFDEYPQFFQALKRISICRLANEAVEIYELAPSAVEASDSRVIADASRNVNEAPDFPRASIIINNYNYGRFLAEAIESALGQTYLDTEVIVVDDGSTDDSRDVINRYENRVTKVFKDNGGQGSAYNAGFVACTGDVVTFLDADDTILPNAIERIVKLMRDPLVAKVQWPLKVVDGATVWRGELSTRRPAPEGDLFGQVVAEGPIYDFDFTTGAAYRRNMLAEVLPMPEQPYRLGGDEYLISVAPTYGLVRTNTEPLGTYRAHGTNHYRDRPSNDERLRQYMLRFEANCQALSITLAKRGIATDIDAWKRRNFNYVWPERLLLAKHDIENAIPVGASYVLVNGDEWDEAFCPPGRNALPLVERNGENWGPPTDDRAAIEELQRTQRETKANYIVFWWTANWWLEHYEQFHKWLRLNHRCVLENERLIVFKLQDLAAPSAR